MAQFGFKVTAAYKSSKVKLLKKYPKADKDESAAATAVRNCPNLGDLFPGVGGYGTRKARFPLRSYNIGKSGGLRLIFFPTATFIVPVHIYAKRMCRTETEEIEKVKENLRLIIQELKREKEAS